MSLEQFPVKEKLATDLDSQIAWLVREMGYSRDKTKGYEEKLVRLARDPSDTQSVFGFMSNYWHRFRQADHAIKELGTPIMVSRALQANAKVVAGLSDKVAFSLWLKDKAEGASREPEELLDTALSMIKERVEHTKDEYTAEELLAFVDKPFEENPMGKAILGLHVSYSQDSQDTDSLCALALGGSAAGVLMWQAYARNLEEHGFSSVMPQPGLSSGTIEDWK